MRRPALRSRVSPFGFKPKEEKTSVGNILAHRSMQLMYVGAQNGATGISETPWSSFMKRLPAWKIVAGLPMSSFVRTDSCRFGSPHQKAFRFMGVNANLDPLSKRCICVGKHLQIQGIYTKGSAIYTPALAEQLALVFKTAIIRAKDVVQADLGIDVKGLENQLVNEIVVSSAWKKKVVGHSERRVT